MYPGSSHRTTPNSAVRTMIGPAHARSRQEGCLPEDIGLQEAYL